MKTILISVLIIILMIISSASLYCKSFPMVKAALNAGLVNGGSVGIEIKQKDAPNLQSFVNAYYLHSGFVEYGGMNYEIRNFKTDRFYTIVSGGVDYGKIGTLMGSPGGSNEDDNEYSTFLMPHITFGIGYQVPMSKASRMFFEWDIGLKASITNINIGMTF